MVNWQAHFNLVYERKGNVDADMFEALLFFKVNDCLWDIHYVAEANKARAREEAEEHRQQFMAVHVVYFEFFAINNKIEELLLQYWRNYYNNYCYSMNYCNNFQYYWSILWAVDIYQGKYQIITNTSRELNNHGTINQMFWDKQICTTHQLGSNNVVC